MKARIIPPPERVDNRTEEEKQADLEKLYRHIEVTNRLRLSCQQASGEDYAPYCCVSEQDGLKKSKGRGTSTLALYRQNLKESKNPNASNGRAPLSSKLP